MLDAMPNTEVAPTKKRRQIAIDEASIDFLGRAARSHPMPEDSLTQSPVRELTADVRALIQRLRNLNMDSLFRAQGLLSQLTGADIEAKMRFELDVRQVCGDVRDLQNKCHKAKRLRQLLRQTHREILAEQERLGRIIDAGRRAVATTPEADPFVMERFQRRLANLTTLQTANELTCAQIALADSNMTSLTDRIDEVTHTLFALWQRDALAVAQSAKPVKKASPLALALSRSHDQFLKMLF